MQKSLMQSIILFILSVVIVQAFIVKAIAEQGAAAPVLMVEDALSSIEVAPGFVVENVAVEPDVFSPVALAFDGDGRMWVAEMTTFMPNLDGDGEEIPKGNIAILEDTNNDGKVDKRTIFLDDIILPRTISMVKGGIVYADQESLYFAEVKQGDKLGIREIIDPTYAKGGSVEHKPNSMLYGLDNWYYNAKSDRRYKFLPLDAEIPKQSKEIYRNKFWKVVLAKTEFRGQWGLSVDDYGRLFHNWNSAPAQGEYLRPNALMKNPELRYKIKANSIGGNRVYPIRENYGVNRGYLPDILVSEGTEKGELVNFTAASGNVVYRGDQFPEHYYGVSFTPEPAANLISAREIIEQEGKFIGKELYQQSEILASTDERFRPVNLYTAPDGTLYIIDMYHGVIQHKEFITPYLREQAKSRGLDKLNTTMGRIYRLRWQDRKLGETPKLSTKSPAELVPYLTHTNGWWRDISRRLIVQANDKSVVDKITSIVIESDDHRAKINALWTLEGLNAINLKVIHAGLYAKHPKVQISAIALSTALNSEDQQKVSQRLSELAQREYQVALQIALTAGELKTDNAFELINVVLAKYEHSPHVQRAVISGISGRDKALKAFLGEQASPSFISLLDQIGQQKIIPSNIRGLLTSEQRFYRKGQVLFEGRAACIGCHGKNGEGLEGMAPPLANSEWVIGNPERLIKILLHGLSGPITVSNKAYDLPMVMPGLGQNNTFSDKDLANIATYIRNNWGNEASVITDEFVTEIRKKTMEQSVPYKASELSK